MLGITLLVVVLFLAVISAVLAGSMGGIGPFKFLHDNKIKNHAGNAAEYHCENIQQLEDSPLRGKRILFLGSSVTKGACALNQSMADDIAARDGAVVTKEAVNGTTLATVKKNSYVERLRALDTSVQYEVIVIQLSTNDASKDVALGERSDSVNKEDFDTNTVIGAIEYTIAYCNEVWNCPVLFYTGTKYDNKNYESMVSALLSLQKKWNMNVLDLWDDADMNAVSKEDYKLYMYDGIHPSRAGYLLWWTPKFEEVLSEMVK